MVDMKECIYTITVNGVGASLNFPRHDNIN
jgi:hypothetical protein